MLLISLLAGYYHPHFQHCDAELVSLSVSFSDCSEIITLFFFNLSAEKGLLRCSGYPLCG